MKTDPVIGLISLFLLLAGIASICLIIRLAVGFEAFFWLYVFVGWAAPLFRAYIRSVGEEK